MLGEGKALDDYIAEFLEAVDRGDAPNPLDFVPEDSGLREDFLRFARFSDGFHLLTTAGNQDSGTETPSKLRHQNALDTVSQPDLQSAAPRDIASYDILRELGRGGMGVVYVAKCRKTQQVVALKVLRNSISRDPTYQERLRRESLAYESLQHENVVDLVDAGIDSEGQSYLAMELVDGVGLDQLIQYRHAIESNEDYSHLGGAVRTPVTGQSIDLGLSELNRGDYFRWVANRTADVAEALHSAHDAGMLHRDVKPSNILVDVTGKAWLTDFGLAVIDADFTTITGSHDILGTLAFMSPEQALGTKNKSIDRRSDIFSLGATLFNAIVLRKPFEGTKVEVLRALLEGSPVKPSRLCKDIPPELDVIVGRAMAFHPRDRYQTAEELALELRRFAAGRRLETRRLGRSQQFFRWCERNSLAAGIAIVGLVFVFAAAITVQSINSISIRSLNSGLSAKNEALEASNLALHSTENRLRRELYVADLSAAYDAFARKDIPAARRVLDRYRIPSESVEDPRGTAWHLLNRLTSAPEPRILCRHDAAATEVAISSDGTIGISVGHDGRCRRFSIAGEMEAPKVFNVGGKLDAITMAPSGAVFYTGKNIPFGVNNVASYSAETGDRVISLYGHWSSVESIAVSPSGNWIASADRYQDVVVHDLKGKVRGRWNTELRNESLDFLDDNHVIAIGKRAPSSSRVRLRVWDVESGSASQVRLPFSPDYFAISKEANESSERRLLVTNWSKGCLLQWPSRKVLANVKGINGRIRCEAISEDGQTLAVGCDQGTVYLWDLTEWQANEELELPAPRLIQVSDARVTDIEFVPRHFPLNESCVPIHQFVTTDENGLVQSWEVPRAPVNRWDPTESMEAAVVAGPLQDASDPDGLYVPLANGQLVRLDIGRQSQEVVCDLEQPIIGEGYLSLQRQRAYLPIREGIAEVNIENPSEIIRTLPVPNSDQTCTGIVCIGDELLASFNSHVAVFGIETGELSNILWFPQDGTSQFVPHPDGETAIVVGSEYGIFRASSKELLVQEKTSVSSEAVGWAEFSADGRLLATAFHDNSVRVRWLDESRDDLRLEGHQGLVRAILFLADDRILATGSNDSTIRFWDLFTGRAMGAIHDVSDSRFLLYDAKRFRLITGNSKGAFSFWELR